MTVSELDLYLTGVARVDSAYALHKRFSVHTSTATAHLYRHGFLPLPGGGWLKTVRTLL
jgi:hypothetical protein